MADNLPPSSTDVTVSGSLNTPDHYRPHRPVMGLLFLRVLYSQTIKLCTEASIIEVQGVRARGIQKYMLMI
jgi:hypothetical protein